MDWYYGYDAHCLFRILILETSSSVTTRERCECPAGPHQSSENQQVHRARSAPGSAHCLEIPVRVSYRTEPALRQLQPHERLPVGLVFERPSRFLVFNSHSFGTHKSGTASIGTRRLQCCFQCTPFATTAVPIPGRDSLPACSVSPVRFFLRPFFPFANSNCVRVSQTGPLR